MATFKMWLDLRQPDRKGTSAMKYLQQNLPTTRPAFGLVTGSIRPRIMGRTCSLSETADLASKLKQLHAIFLKMVCNTLANDAASVAVVVIFVAALQVDGRLVFLCAFFRDNARFVVLRAVLERQFWPPLVSSGAHENELVQLRCWSLAQHKH